MNAKQTNEDKIYVYSSFKQFCLHACSCLSSSVAMYSSKLRQKLRTEMFITGIVHIRKCWGLEINH